MKKLSFLFALLCASVMGWAVDQNTWIGSTDATYNNQFKWSAIDGVATPTEVVNIQKPGWSEEIGIYTHKSGYNKVTFNGVEKTNGTHYHQDGAGVVLFISALVDKNTEVKFYDGENLVWGLNIYNDKGAGDSGDEPGTGGGNDPGDEPAGIDWSKIGWLTNSSGNAAYTEKYKALAGDPGPSNIDVIQSPGWATKPGLYITFPNADFRNFSLPASCYSIQGAGIVFHMDAFTAKETTVHVNVGGTVRSFTIYYVDGTEGPAEIYDVNFALADNGSSATASSGTAANAIDGNNGTRWESSATDDETWTLDMGQKRIFNTIKINWETAYCTQFNLTCSNDGETWSPLYTETNLTSASWQTIELENNVTARYIKYHGTKRATGWGQSFFEFQVLLPGVSTLTSISLNAAAAVAQVGGAGVALTAQPKDQNGQNMEAEVSYEITPAAAGHMSGNTFIPDQIGAASIRAYNGEIFSQAVTIAAYAGSNLALSTNISTDNKVIAQSEFSPSGTNAYFAVDPDEGSVYQGSPTNGNVNNSREYDSWFVVDLGGFYDINMVTIKFEGACSELYHVDFSMDNSTWNLGYNYVGSEGINGHTDYLTALDNNIKVRYVRFWSTKAATGWGMKIFDMKVFGTEWVDSGDTEAPVMTSASLVSSTATSAVIAVAATDNVEVLKYHVVDATNSIDANYYESEGKIEITGLTHNTAYNFTITAIDAANHESENSKQVAVTTPFDVTINLALNKTCEGGYYDNNPAESDDKANDGNTNTQWTTYGAHAVELDWWVVDLGQIYNLTNITILWGDQYATNYILQARVEAPSAADKADDAAWVTLATVADAAANAEKSTNVSGVGRYLRFRALAHTGFMRLKEFRAYASGVAEVDTEKPVMGAASLISNTDVQAIISVEATDNNLVTSYHVVDAGNSIDATLAPVDGKITVTGLTQGTAYTFVIKAIDLFGNESDNSKSVAVTTSAHYTEPQAACPAPTWDADLVKAMYSPTYSANYTHQDWGSGTEATVDEFGRKYVVPASGYFGADGFSHNCINMEKLHYDIWIADDATLRIVPICRNTANTGNEPEVGVTVNLTGQQWNSIDLTLDGDYDAVTNWSNVYQVKIENAANLTFWVANAYFYREAAYVDNVAPTNASASLVVEGFYSIRISAQAEDNSGSVNFKVMAGEEILATGAAATGVATTMTINNLDPGTAYSFNVVAYDDANNAAEPIAIVVNTKAIPAAAPAPTYPAGMVMSLYSDVYAPVVNVANYCEAWWESPTVHNVVLGSGDNAKFYDNNHKAAASFGWAWSGDNKIDFTNYQKLHLSVYPAAGGTIEIYPVVQPEAQFHKVSQTLVAGQWNDIVLDYTEKTFAPLNQIGFVNFYDLGEFFVDNVYFFSEAEDLEFQDNADNAEVVAANAGKWVNATVNRTFPYNTEWYTLCLPFDLDDEQLEDVFGAGYELAVMAGAEDRGSLIHLNFNFVHAIEAGKAYLLKPGVAVTAVPTFDAVQIKNVNPAELKSTNAYMEFQGTFSTLTLNDENQRFLGRENNLYSPAEGGTTMKSFRCFFTIPSSSPAAGVPARVVFSSEVATGMDAVQSDNAQRVKVLREGQLFIIRDNRIYNAQGVLVK